ncbi:hypothetical protein JOF28_001151 [Leucobacter exalbidus]|uniref:DUF4241 domain-containing protein n=1 Tax=Leucobacter exalbidus TaxID=662960 RepID=A0A940T3M3_9MICO|nr:DUF4241 domain-containing protein [Leucobacter exalbidus]MBP1325919.1 hypothetical protein [Leucobacter exalbidus]
MTSSSESRHPAEERVQEFMAEFDAQWHSAAPAFENRDPANPLDPFKLWHGLMAQTTRNHFTDSSTIALGQSFDRPAQYGPDAEWFLRSEGHENVAYVLTQSTSPLARIHEYTVRVQSEDWKISAITDHSSDPILPFVDRVSIDASVQECAVGAPFTEMPEAEAQLDEVRNFTDREVTRARDGETSRVEVSGIGTLVTSTGVLTVLDFGYDNDDAHPLSRTVNPGSYPVDRVTAFGRNAAVRVRFSDQTPVAWHPASIPGSGHVVGVDAGCVVIADYVGYASMTRRDKAAAFDNFTAIERPATLEFSLGDAGVGFAADSGYGDGSYPVYWGEDANGEVAELVVDFMVLVAADDDGVLKHM